MIPDKQRTVRFIASAIVLLSIGGIVSAIGHSLKINPFISVCLYVGFLCITSCLIALLAGRLFRHHEMRKLKFDISAMIILTTLIALPLGFSSAFQHLAETTDADISRQELRGVLMIVVSGLLYFSLFPILIAAEALLIWCLRRRKHRRAE